MTDDDLKFAAGEPTEYCDHRCLLRPDHEGEHFYGYNLPSDAATIKQLESLWKYKLGEIEFEFLPYDGWQEDVRTAAAFLLRERDYSAPAKRLLAAFSPPAIKGAPRERLEYHSSDSLDDRIELDPAYCWTCCVPGHNTNDIHVFGVYKEKNDSQS